MPRCQVCDKSRKDVSVMQIAGMMLALCLKCRDQVKREKDELVGKGRSCLQQETAGEFSFRVFVIAYPHVHCSMHGMAHSKRVR